MSCSYKDSSNARFCKYYNIECQFIVDGYEKLCPLCPENYKKSSSKNEEQSE
jgi:hypothetical protein